MAKKKVFSIGNALAEGLEETIAAANNYSGELRIEVIPVRKIEVDPENPRDLALTFEDMYHGIQENDPDKERKDSEYASLQSISNSIRDQGIINPIVVYKFGEKYRLVAGERRTLASILAKKTDIQAKILDSKPSELKISLLQWVENIERSDLSLWERLKNLEKIVAAYAQKMGTLPRQVTITELSNLIGCTKPHAMNYKAVLNADDTIKKLIQDNQIRNLEKAAVIASIETTSVKTVAINACLQGATLKKLKVIAEQARELPATSKKTPETRSRTTSTVQFGETQNVDVAKIIFDSVLNHHSVAHISKHYHNVNWNDNRDVSERFKHLIKKLEELHT